MLKKQQWWSSLPIKTKKKNWLSYLKKYPKKGAFAPGLDGNQWFCTSAALVLFCCPTSTRVLPQLAKYKILWNYFAQQQLEAKVHAGAQRLKCIAYWLSVSRWEGSYNHLFSSRNPLPHFYEHFENEFLKEKKNTPHCHGHLAKERKFSWKASTLKCSCLCLICLLNHLIYAGDLQQRGNKYAAHLAAGF